MTNILSNLKLVSVHQEEATEQINSLLHLWFNKGLYIPDPIENYSSLTDTPMK